MGDGASCTNITHFPRRTDFLLVSPLIERSECSEILYAQHVEGSGKLLFQEVCERNLEGVVAKRRMSVYAEHGWLKIKNPKYTQAEGRHDLFTRFHARPG